MTIGLDLGSHQFRSMRSDGEELIARHCPAVFVTISDTPGHRRLLQQSNTRFATCSGQLLVLGDAAREWSSMLNIPLTPLFRSGRIPASDSISRQILTLIIDAMLPAPSTPGRLCRMTLPGGANDERVKNPDSDFFQQLVALRGYRPQVMSATQALALAELNDAGFTGITITLGHTTSEFGAIHCGREIIRCVVMNGLENLEGAPMLGDTNGAPEQSVPENIEREYVRFFTDILTEARAEFEQEGTLKTLPQSMSVVCAGSITSARPFLPLFQRAWNDGRWPVSTQPIRVALDPNLAVVRGCLIQAELDEPRERQAA